MKPYCTACYSDDVLCPFFWPGTVDTEFPPRQDRGVRRPPPVLLTFPRGTNFPERHSEKGDVICHKSAS